jgi:hypothetical protein
MYGVDIGLFNFQRQLTWAAVFLNADGTVYGRYGSRGPRRGMKDNDKDISLEGFKSALEGALEIHKGYPGNKASLAGKRGSAPLAERPERLPAAPPEEAKPAAGGEHGCVHCHQVQDWELMSLWKASKPVPDALIWPYPMPDALGLVLDPRQRATVSRIEEGSAAQQAGFRSGDKVLKLEGQPIISIADVQWVLHQAEEPSTLAAEVERGERRERLELSVPQGWRRRTDFANTLSLGWTTRMFVAGMRSTALGAEEKRRLGLDSGALALRIDEITPDWVKRRNTSAREIGLRKGDVIVEVDGKKTAMSESELLRYLLQEKKPGDKVELSYLRDGKTRAVELALPAKERSA